MSRVVASSPVRSNIISRDFSVLPGVRSSAVQERSIILYLLDHSIAGIREIISNAFRDKIPGARRSYLENLNHKYKLWSYRIAKARRLLPYWASLFSLLPFLKNFIVAFTRGLLSFLDSLFPGFRDLLLDFGFFPPGLFFPRETGRFVKHYGRTYKRGSTYQGGILLLQRRVKRALDSLVRKGIALRISGKLIDRSPGKIRITRVALYKLPRAYLKSLGLLGRRRRGRAESFTLEIKSIPGSDFKSISLEISTGKKRILRSLGDYRYRVREDPLTKREYRSFPSGIDLLDQGAKSMLAYQFFQRKLWSDLKEKIRLL